LAADHAPVGGDISQANIAQDVFLGSMSATLPVLAGATLRPRNRLHVFTLTPFYTVENDDAQGCFVSEPLPLLAELGITNTVFAVRPFYRGRPRANTSAPAGRWKQYFSLPGGLGLPISGTATFASILMAVRRIHREHPIDLIHAHSALPCGHAAALLSRYLEIPFVVTVHGLDAFFTNQVRGYAGQWCTRISQQVYRAARAVVCISERVHEEVTRNIDGPLPAAVVYNGVDPGRFYAELRPYPSNAILSVGNLIPIKGHELLLRALAAIEERCPSLRCEIIGDGPERSHLRALSSQLGIAQRVAFLGRRSRTQVADAMRGCTVFALPSRYEGLGCVYLEAMSAAKPVIACRGQGIEEIIRHGANGFLIEPGNVDALGGTIAMLVDDPQLRNTVGGEARRTIMKSFTLAQHAERLSNIYRECLA